MAGCGDETIAPCTDAPAGANPNPTGEFANTLIRGRPPGSEYAGNTTAAIEEADAGGYRYVEIDVRVTADGHLLPCRHDDLARFSDCRGRVAESTLADLEGCTTTDRSPAALLPLEDALVAASFSGIYLDLKSTDTDPITPPERVRDAVVALSSLLEDPGVVVAMSYRRDTAEALLAAGVRTALKGYPDEPADTLLMLDEAAAAGAEMICVNASALDDAVAVRAEERRLWLLPWAHVYQVDRGLMCDLQRWSSGGLISDGFDEVDTFLLDP